MRRLRIPTVALLVALSGAATAFGAITMTYQVVPRPNKASTKKKVQPIQLETKFTIGDDTGTQPSPLRRVVEHYRDGGTFNGRLFPRCKLSELEDGGPAACPRGSLVGAGTGTGSARPIVDSVRAKLILFSGELEGGNPTILIYVRPELGPSFVVRTVVSKERDGTYTSTVEVPPIPTLPGQPNAAVTSTDIRTRNVFVKRRVREKIRGRRVTRTFKLPFIGAPKSCKGTWRFEADFMFQSGETRNMHSAAPCRM
jgi:hypothetical protein